MPDQITINIPTIIAFCGLVVAIGGAATYVSKLLKPLKKPYEEIQSEFEDIELRSAACEKRFTTDEKRIDEHEKILVELANDNRVLLESEKSFPAQRFCRIMALRRHRNRMFTSDKRMIKEPKL